MMKRMQLTEEEARLIEQRRMMENRENLGYNQCLTDLNAVWPVWPIDRETGELLQSWIETHRKAIKP